MSYPREFQAQGNHLFGFFFGFFRVPPSGEGREDDSGSEEGLSLSR